MSIYSEPVSTPDELYLNYYGSPLSFGELADHITAHFGMDVKLNEFSIEVERKQVRGCSCCNDNSDYELYMVITKRKDPCEYTDNRLVDSMAIT